MAAIVLAACSTSPGHVVPGSTPVPATTEAGISGARAAHALRRQPAEDAAADLVGAVLAQAGVEVVEDMTSTATAAVRVTRWQVTTMASQASTGGGVPGRTLDALAPAPPGAPPLPFLIAAWMKQAETQGAQFSRALLAGQPASRALDMRFPDLVVALFLADATATRDRATPRTSEGASRASRRGPAHAIPARFGVVDAPCSAVSDFVHQAVAAVVRALTIRTTGSGFAGFLAAIWNTAVALASGVVERLVGSASKALVGQLVGTFGALAAVQQISSALIPWRAPLTPDPTANRFGLEPQVVTGSVTLQLQPHILPLPAALQDCARSVGVDLTASAKGSRVTWTTAVTGRKDLARATSQAEQLDAGESAAMAYQTGGEPADAAGEPELTGTLSVSSTMRRNDVEKLRQMIASVLLAQVPVEIRSIVDALARPLLDSATGRLAELVDVHSATSVTITYHKAPPLCRKGLVDPGTYTGRIDTGLTNRAAKGHASGTITVKVTEGQKVTGTIELESSARWHGITSSATEELAVSGTTAKPVVTLVKRTMDGRDATFPQRGRTPRMTGKCSASLRWDLSSLSPGTKPTTPDGFVVIATRPS